MHQDPAAIRELESKNDYVETTLGVPELDFFADKGLITRIHAQLTSGKEGTVYCCRAHPSTNRKFIAAKVYREHAENSYKWDPTYFQGRERLLKPQTIRAIQARSEFGKQVAAGLWVGSEYENLQRMHSCGLNVPEPLAIGSRVVLMEYIGNGAGPAPHLDGIDLDPESAKALYHQLMSDIRTLLANHLVHGDLSPYNILVWKGEAWLIDAPQAVDARMNQSAFQLLHRDIENVCRYFEKHGIRSRPLDLAIEWWDRYQRAQL